MKKLLCFIATLSLLTNTLLAPISVIAQTVEESPTPTPTDTAVIEPTETPTNESTVLPTETVIPTPTPETIESATPTPTSQPIETQAPESSPTVQGPPETAATPIVASETSTENGIISAVILENEKVDESILNNFDLDYTEDGSATITTDKLDYSPTDTAVISGTGFIAEKTYTINITSSDEPEVDFSDSITANDEGEILYSYTLDGTYRPDYQVKILDGERVVAETTFTDSRHFGTITVNGGDTTDVNPSDTITVATNVRTDGSDEGNDWESTGYVIEGFSQICDNSPNITHDSGFTSSTYDLVAPTNVGSYNLSVIAYSNNWCSGYSNSILLSNAINVQTSCGTTSVYEKSNDFDNREINIDFNDYYNRATVTAKSGYALVSIWYDYQGDYEYDLDDPWPVTMNPAVVHASGNITNIRVTIQRVCTSVDTTAPIITLNGPTPVNVELGSIYTDAGAIATDNIDGDITSKIVPVSSVNTSIIGTYTVTYNVSDAAGNPATEVIRTVKVVDTIAPTVPTNGQPNNVYLNTNDYYFTWSSSIDFSPVIYEFQSSNTNTVDGDGSLQNVWNSIADGNSEQNHLTTPTIHSVGAADGLRYWQVRAIDSSDNKSAWSETWNRTIDTVDPIITIDPYTTIPTNQDITVTAQANGGTLNEDSHTFTSNGSFDFIATDLAGNTTIQTVTITNIDKEIPSNPTTSLTANGISVPTNGFTNSYTFTFKLTSSTDVNRYQLKYWNDIPGSGFKESTPWSPTNLGGYMSPFGLYNDRFTQGEGKHFFSFSACDPAGNCSPFTSPFVVTYDKTAPVVHISSPLAGIVSGVVSVEGTVTDSNPHHYYLVIKNSLGSVVAGPGTVNNSHNFSGKFFDWNTTSGAFPDGIYTIQLAARDAANNRDDSVSLDTKIVTVDNTAPTGTWINPINNATVSGTIALNFAATDNLSGVASTVYKYKAVGEIDFRNDGMIIGNAWDTTGIALGDYIVRAEVTDNTGNVSEFDITVGVAAVISSQNAIGVSTNSITVTWTTDRPTTSRVVYDTVSHDTLGTGDNYGYALSTTEDTNKVTDHSVTLTDLSTGETYYYRVISHGSPAAIGGEGYAITLTNAGPPEASGATGGVLGTTTGGLLANAFPQFAFVTGESGGTETESIEVESGGSTEPEVLGAETENEVGGFFNWIKNHMGLSLGIVTLLGLIIFFITKRRKKDSQ